MGAAPGELAALATTAALGGSRKASNGNVARPQLVPVPKCAATTERMQHGETGIKKCKFVEKACMALMPSRVRLAVSKNLG